MVPDSFGVHIPGWLSQVVTFAVVGYFFAESGWKNKKEACKQEAAGNVSGKAKPEGMKNGKRKQKKPAKKRT